MFRPFFIFCFTKNQALLIGFEEVPAETLSWLGLFLKRYPSEYAKWKVHPGQTIPDQDWWFLNQWITRSFLIKNRYLIRLNDLSDFSFSSL